MKGSRERRFSKRIASRIEQAWLTEAERRYKDFQAGKTEGIPGNQAFEQIRRELGWRT
jgi:hypothetical protein